MTHPDESIDRAVREMLDAEPSRDFVRRVMEQLEDSQARRGRAIWMMPLAAATLVILAVALAPLLRPRTITVPRQQAATVAQPVPRPSTPAPQIAERRSPVTRLRERGPRPPIATAVPVGAPPATIAIDPLSSIEPIPVAPVQTDSLAIAPVHVAPLAALAPIDVEPLAPTRDRD